MDINGIAEIIGAKHLIWFNGILTVIAVVEAMVIRELAYRVGGMRKLFSCTLKIYKHRRNNTNNKTDKATPNEDY